MSNLHEIRTVRCAHCGKLRQEANHWFVASVDNGKFRCAPLISRAKERAATRAALHLARGLKKNQEPACGQHCAQKLFERYLSSAAMRQCAVARATASATASQSAKAEV
jgi:phage FluMu protein Com